MEGEGTIPERGVRHLPGRLGRSVALSCFLRVEQRRRLGGVGGQGSGVLDHSATFRSDPGDLVSNSPRAPSPLVGHRRRAAVLQMVSRARTRPAPSPTSSLRSRALTHRPGARAHHRRNTRDAQATWGAGPGAGRGVDSLMGGKPKGDTDLCRRDGNGQR